jgi:hypothetical protein
MNKFNEITHSIPTSKKKKMFPCRIHLLFKHCNEVYGVNAAGKRRKVFTSFFNNYKKISKKVIEK